MSTLLSYPIQLFQKYIVPTAAVAAGTAAGLFILGDTIIPIVGRYVNYKAATAITAGGLVLASNTAVQIIQG